MAFILAADGRYADVVGAFRRYQEYLQSLRDVFPPSAFTLATSDWYFNFNDHRCPLGPRNRVVVSPRGWRLGYRGVGFGIPLGPEAVTSRAISIPGSEPMRSLSFYAIDVV